MDDYTSSISSISETSSLNFLTFLLALNLSLSSITFNIAVIIAMNKPKITPKVCNNSVVLIDIDKKEESIPYSGFLVSVSDIDAINKDLMIICFSYL